MAWKIINNYMVDEEEEDTIRGVEYGGVDSRHRRIRDKFSRVY